MHRRETGTGPGPRTAARPAGAALLLAVGLAVAGCGGPHAVDVSGTITFGGKPLPAGRVYFNPDFTRGNDGPQGYAQVEGGRFDTRKGGQGACGGPTVVVIQGYAAGPEGAPGSMGSRLFREFQIETDLPRQSCTRDFDVPASAAQDLLRTPRKGRKP